MIQIHNIQYAYADHQVLSGVSFCAKQGEKVVIVGRNGCGKTTLLKILAGVMKPDEGNLLYYGKNPLQEKKVFSKLCGYVPQENPLIEELTVLDNLKLWGYDKSGRDQSVIQDFELDELLKTRVYKLSGGMKRRVGIAVATIHHPPIMILDEPTTALDIFYKEQVESWLKKYQSMGGIVVMTTHEENEIQDADYCLLMHEGKVQEVTGEQRNMKFLSAGSTSLRERH